MRRVNVLLLITELNVGGAEKVVADLAAHLSPQRYKVQVACLYAPGAVAEDLTAAGIPVLDLHMRGKGDWRIIGRLFRLLRQEQIHIVHSHLFHANLLAAVVGASAGTPLIVNTRHSVNIGGAARELLNRVTAPLRDATVAISTEVYAAELHRARPNPAQVLVIPNGVRVKTFAPPAAPELAALRQTWHIASQAPVIGTIARFAEPKGHTYLLDAASRVLTCFPATKILLVGDGPLRPTLQEKAAALGLTTSIIFTGIRRDIPSILALLDLFVLPSLWEGLPISILEAMAAGKPVVATAVGGVPEVVRPDLTGILVPPRDPAALATAIISLLQDPARARAMGAAGRARVAAHFSVEAMVAQTEALYEKLLRAKLGLAYVDGAWQALPPSRPAAPGA